MFAPTPPTNMKELLLGESLLQARTHLKLRVAWRTLSCMAEWETWCKIRGPTLRLLLLSQGVLDGANVSNPTMAHGFCSVFLFGGPTQILVVAIALRKTSNLLLMSECKHSLVGFGQNRLWGLTPGEKKRIFNRKVEEKETTTKNNTFIQKVTGLKPQEAPTNGQDLHGRARNSSALRITSCCAGPLGAVSVELRPSCRSLAGFRGQGLHFLDTR